MRELQDLTLAVARVIMVAHFNFSLGEVRQNLPAAGLFLWERPPWLVVVSW